MQDMFYAMTESEIASEMGLSRAAVRAILHRALEKIRRHPELCARFRQAVEENRQAIDRRWMSRPLVERIQ